MPISRTYYIVRTATALLEVYRDGRAGDWYLQRVVDWRHTPGTTMRETEPEPRRMLQWWTPQTPEERAALDLVADALVRIAQDMAEREHLKQLNEARNAGPDGDWNRYWDENFEQWGRLARRRDRLQEQMAALDEKELQIDLALRRAEVTMGRRHPGFKDEASQLAYLLAPLEVSEEREFQCRAEYDALEAKADAHLHLHQDRRFEARYRLYLTRRHDAEDLGALVGVSGCTTLSGARPRPPNHKRICR